MNSQRFLLPALIVLTLMRLLLLPLRELAPVEAYGYMCSQRLDIWHAMLGPLLPVLVRVTTNIFGMSEFGVRVAAPLLTMLATVLLWRMARGFFDATTASWSVVIFSALPVVNLASVTMTPMTLSITGSVALLYVLRVALHRSHPRHVFWYSVAAMMVLLFLTDWRFLMFAFATAAALAVTRRGRSAVLKWPVLPILLGSLGVALTIGLAWSSEHKWMPISTVGDPHSQFTRELWNAVLAHSPVMIAALGWALTRSVLRKPLTYPVAYLYAFASPMLTLDVFTFLSAPWPMAGFGGWVPPVSVLLAHQLSQWMPRHIQLKTWLRTCGIVLALVQSCIVLQTDAVRSAGTAWKLTTQDSTGVSRLPADPMQDLVGWRSLAGHLKELLADVATQSGVLPYVVADRWQLAAPLSFYLRDAHAAQPTLKHPLINAIPSGATPDAFSLWPPPVGLQGPVLFVTDDPECKAPPPSLLDSHPQFRLCGWFDVTHQGLLVRTIKVFACSAEITGKK